jgi:hypothetical protein
MEVTDEYEKEELEQFSISTLEKIGKLNGIKINKFDGVGGEIVTNTQETAEESFERRFGRKAE